MKEFYTTGSMFAGIGGICLGFKNAGAKMVWANEFDSKACLTYRTNLGNDYLIEGDIRNIQTKDIPDLDILTAGFPCQAFSIAGYRKGFNDDRGNLFFEVMRVIEAKKPEVIFLENVKNLVTHDKHRTFRIIYEALENEGYKIKYQVLNTKDYGNIPQTRERIYIVGFKNKVAYDAFTFPKPIKLNKNIHDIIDKSNKVPEKYYYNNFMHIDKLKSEMKNPNTVYQWRRQYVRENKSNVCPTLTANMGTGGHNVPLIIDSYGFRKLTPKECLAFQGFPKSFKIPEDVGDAQIYKQAGNAVSVPVIERIAHNIVNALNFANGYVLEIPETERTPIQLSLEVKV